jgi:hypothetical protein
MIEKGIMRNGEFWKTETSFHHYCKIFVNGMVGGVGTIDGSNAIMSLPARLCFNLRHHTPIDPEMAFFQESLAP